MNGYPPLVLDLEAVRDVDHVIAVFRERGLWGAVAKSNFAGLRFRAPIYRSLRELALSYFESYYNLRGERTLRGYSRPVNLSRFDHLDWMTSEKPVWAVAEHLVTVSHFPLFPARLAKNLPRLDRRSFDAGLDGIREALRESQALRALEDPGPRIGPEPGCSELRRSWWGMSFIAAGTQARLTYYSLCREPA